MSAPLPVWPGERVGEALEALARRGLERQRPARPRTLRSPDAALTDVHGFERWLDAGAAALGLEVEPCEAAHGELERMLHGAAPALLRLVEGKGAPRYLALVGAGRHHVALLGPDLRVHRVALERVRDALAHAAEAPLAAGIDRLLDDVGVTPRRRPRARAALMGQRLGGARIGGVYLLRLPPAADFLAHARGAGLVRRLGLAVAAHIGQYLLWMLSWLVIGQAALSGRVSSGWMTAWALLVATFVPLKLLATWSAGRFGIEAGALLKQRLLAGALRMRQDQLRSEGVGQLLGRVIESDTIESLLLGGGFQAGLAVIELLIAVPVLLAGGGALLAGLLLVWLAVTMRLVWTAYQRRRHWTETRRSMTHDLVESMAGHRTRLTQERREDWHTDEDAAVERSFDAARALDRAVANLMTFGQRGWLLVGLVALVPTILAGAPPVRMALGVGGVILSYQALRRLVSGLGSLAGAWIAWGQVAPLFHAAAQSDGAPALVSGEPEGSAGAVLVADELVYKYPGRLEPVLRGASLRLAPGTRVLLEGSSGGGKSTLGALLTGLRVPDGGTLLLDGMDLHTLGVHSWRRRVASAPQFHDNHVLSGTLGFNLLMGRAWPPRPEDLDEAERICRELGLGPLLERMPSGLQQMVGETGWQLSHGERSRLYIARTLLQRADVVVLDESFASLDPATLTQAMACVTARARALLVIAHP